MFLACVNDDAFKCLQERPVIYSSAVAVMYITSFNFADLQLPLLIVQSYSVNCNKASL